MFFKTPKHHGHFYFISSDGVKRIPILKDQSILECLIKAKVKIDHLCGGHASCGTCLINVHQGLASLSERNGLEQEMAQDRGFKPMERLACQTLPVKEVKIAPAHEV